MKEGWKKIKENMPEDLQKILEMSPVVSEMYEKIYMLGWMDCASVITKALGDGLPTITD